MKEYSKDDAEKQPQVNEEPVDYAAAQSADDERLRKHIYMSDMEKLHSFTRMLIRNATFKKAIVTHKK